jgi:hypothetical protein
VGAQSQEFSICRLAGVTHCSCCCWGCIDGRFASTATLGSIAHQMLPHVSILREFVQHAFNVNNELAIPAVGFGTGEYVHHTRVRRAHVRSHEGESMQPWARCHRALVPSSPGSETKDISVVTTSNRRRSTRGGVDGDRDVSDRRASWPSPSRTARPHTGSIKSTLKFRGGDTIARSRETCWWNRAHLC